MQSSIALPPEFMDVTNEARRLAISTSQLAQRVEVLAEAYRSTWRQMHNIAIATKLNGNRKLDRDPGAGFSWMQHRAYSLEMAIMAEMCGFVRVGTIMHYQDGSGDRLIGWRMNDWWAHPSYAIELITVRRGTSSPISFCDVTHDGTRFYHPITPKTHNP